MIKVGIVGCGRILPAHLHGFKILIEKSVDVRISALCSRTLEGAMRYWKREADIPPYITGGPPGDPLTASPIYVYDFQKDVDVNVYDNYEKMLKDANIDAITTYTPVSLHHMVAIAGLEAGKHVLVEKPFAVSVKAARKMVEVAKRVGKVLGIAESAYYNPPVRMTKWAIERGYIGDIKMAVSLQIGGYWAPDKIVARTAWRHKKLLGGGAVLDIAAHHAGILQYLCGDIEKVYCVTKTLQKTRYDRDEIGNVLEKVECDADDTYIATFYFKNGIIGHLYWSWFGPSESTTIPFPTVYGTRGCIQRDVIILNDGTKMELKSLFEIAAKHEEKERYFPYGIKDRFALETLEFVRAIEEGREMETGGEKGLKDLAVAFAMHESSLRGEPVKVEDVLEGRLSLYEDEINKYYNI